jgi:ATP-dependent protease ClpP protease subunit
VGVARTQIVGVLAIALLVAWAPPVWGDRVVLQNGRVLDGKVVAEDVATITLQMEIGSSTLTQRLKKEQLKSVTRTADVRPDYVTLPVIGAIGNDVTAAALRAGFAEARRANAHHVVLAIDSPGGEIGEMTRIIDAIVEAQKEFEVVAIVKRAHSAAAVVAMTCPRIYMTPKATIGATVPFRITPTGPEEVDAKMRSIIQAMMRAATATGGHADLLIRGMSEINLEIYLARDEDDEGEGTLALRTFGPGKLIKAKGQILTLTADEAAECGLATVARNLADVGKHEVGDDPWNEGPRRPWETVVGHTMMVKWRVVNRLTDLKDRIRAVNAALSDLCESHSAELARIEAEYQHAMRAAQFQRNPQLAAARAGSTRDTRQASARHDFAASLAQLNAERNAIVGEAAQLEAEYPDLMTQAARD